MRHHNHLAIDCAANNGANKEPLDKDTGEEKEVFWHNSNLCFVHYHSLYVSIIDARIILTFNGRETAELSPDVAAARNSMKAEASSTIRSSSSQLPASLD